MNKQYQEKEFWYFEQAARPEMYEFINKNNIKKVLDVGCSTGGFAKRLKEDYNCLTWGIEPYVEAYEIAKMHLDVVVNSSIEGALAKLDQNSFDHIFFIDVLEHLEDPWTVLTAIKGKMTHDGRIIASIPNIRYYPVILGLLRYCDFRYVQSGVMDKTHLRFFTRLGMIRLFEECGFKVIKVKPINRVRYVALEIFNIIFFGKLWDMRYPQFAIVAELI